MKKFLCLLFSLTFFLGISAYAYDETYAGTLTPGKNFVTGDATYETFEDYGTDELPEYFTAETNAEKSISEDTDMGGKSGTNKSFKFLMYDTYPNLYWGLPNSLEAERKYFLSADIYADTTTGITNFWVMQSGASSNNVLETYASSLIDSVTDGVWLDLDKTLTSVTAKKMYFQMAITSAIKQVNHFHIDNFAFVPYYKITYDGVETEYVLFEDESVKDLSKLMTTYTVKSDNYPEWSGDEAEAKTCIGWATTADAASAITSVPLGGDITLYPVWYSDTAAEEDEDTFEYVFDGTQPGIANGTITVTLAPKNVSYTTAEILLANDDSFLSDYTAFGYMTLTDGVGTYSVTGNRAFPTEATRLAVRLYGDGLSDVYIWYTIPEEKRLTLTSEPLYTFWATSDSHLSGTTYEDDFWPEMTVNRDNAMEDIMSTNADFMFINGDVIHYGDTSYRDLLVTYLADRLNNPEYNVNNIPVFLTNGNHEYYENAEAYDLEAITTLYNSQLDYISQNYGDKFTIIKGEGDVPWYAVQAENIKLIFLSSPEGSDSNFSFCEAQLKFLDEQLYDGERSNLTNCVITHAPLAYTIPGNYKTEYTGGITNTTEVNQILAKHPNTIVFSGHSHSDLSTDLAHFTVVNDMTTTPSHINDGCLVYLSAWGGGRILDYSTGVYLEVYSDMIYIRSRKFDDDSMYFGHGVYVMDIPDKKSELHDVSMTGETKDGAVFTALVDGTVPADDAPYTYEWYIDGEVISTEKSFTLDLEGNFADQKVILRVYNEDGEYSSCISEGRFSGVSITYELGDATGGSVPDARTWIPDTYMQPDIGSAFPKKTGYYFKGWSTQQGASVPIAKIKITKDTTFYPVFDDKPEFYFDANLSGFKSNGLATGYAINDGIFNVTSDGADVYFTWSNSTFDAETYKYMRIKSAYVSGTGDSMFYTTTDNSGWATTKQIALSKGTTVAKADGMDIKEYDITSITENWTGTINKLRFDVLLTAGEANVDYVVFAEKPGVYFAHITVDGETALLSDDTVNCTVDSFSLNGDTVSATLVPADGYEFTSDFAHISTINGLEPTTVTVNDDGSVFVEYNPVPDDGIIIYLGERASEENVRFVEIDGIQRELIENGNNTYILDAGDKNLLVEITEKTSADTSEIVKSQYFYVDAANKSYTKLNLDSYMTTDGKKSIRIKEPMGIRFRYGALTCAKTEEDDFVIDEIGFIVAVTDVLGEEDLTLDFPKYVKGVAYNKAEGTDIVFDSSDDNVDVFTCVVKNLPVSKYKTNLTCKTYTKITVGGEQFTVYGEAVMGNVYDTAQKLLETDPENADFIEIVLDADYSIGVDVGDLYA